MNSTLGYYNMAKISAVKGFVVMAPGCFNWRKKSEICGLYYKTFRIVIYDRNDSTIVEPVL